MQSAPTSPAPFPKKLAVRLAVGLALVFTLCGVLVVAAVVVPTERGGASPGASSATVETSHSHLTAQQDLLLEKAKADPDYRVWSEVDELTREVPDDLDAFEALRRRLESIEGRWTSLGYSAGLARAIESGRRMQTTSARAPFLKHAADAVSNLRADVHTRVIQTILARDLPALPVSRADLLAFGRQEGMVESWDEGGRLESAEWRSWSIAPSSKQKGQGSPRFAKGTHVTVACDATGAVKSASLSVDLPGDSDYLTELLKLPEADRDARHAARVGQILAELPTIVRRFLLVAAPEQADATVQKASELATQNPAQLAKGIKNTTIWIGTLTQGEDRQVEFMLIAGGGLCVIVDQPQVRSRLNEIADLTKALGE